MWSDLAALDDHRLGATNSPFKLPITLTITSVVTPNILAGQNNGSFLSTSISPTPFIWIYCTNMGPTTTIGLHVAGSLVDTLLAGTRLLLSILSCLFDTSNIRARESSPGLRRVGASISPSTADTESKPEEEEQ
jgi:hypothetical protein